MPEDKAEELNSSEEFPDISTKELEGLEEDFGEKPKKPERPKKKKKKIKWEIPVFVIGLIFLITDLFFLPDTKEVKLRKYLEKGERSFLKGFYTGAIFYIEKAILIGIKDRAVLKKNVLLLADAYYGRALQKKSSGEPYGMDLEKSRRAYQWFKNFLLDKYEDFYTSYQIAKCSWLLGDYQKAYVEFRDLEKKIDFFNKLRLLEEKEGTKLSKIRPIWPESERLRFSFSEPPDKIYYYYADTLQNLKRYKDAALIYKKYARVCKRGKEQLKTWLMIGKLYSASGLWEESKLWLKKVLKEYSDDPLSKEAFYLLGLAELKDRHFQKARFYFQQATGNYPFDLFNDRAHFMENTSYILEGNLKEAYRRFNRMEMENKDKPLGIASRIQIARIKFLEKKFEECYDIIEWVFQKYGKDAIHNNPFINMEKVMEILDNLASHSIEEKEYDVAIKVYKFIIKNFHQDLDHIYWRLGNTYLTVKNWEEAGKSFIKIPQVNPASSFIKEAYWEAANAFFKANDRVKAVKVYEDFINNFGDDPRVSIALYKKGLAEKDVGMLEDAIFDFERNIRDYPNNLYAYFSRYELAKIYAIKNELDKAINLYREILNDPRFTPESKVWRDSCFDIGRLLFRKGNFIEASKYLLEVTQRYPEDSRIPEIKAILGKCYLKIGKYDEAKRYFEELIETSSSSELLKDALLGIANVFYKTKQYSQAIEYLKMALNKFINTPDAPWIAFLLGKCYEGEGNMEKAKIEYNKSMWMYKKLKSPYQGKFWSEMLKWLIDTRTWYIKQKEIEKTLANIS